MKGIFQKKGGSIGKILLVLFIILFLLFIILVLIAIYSPSTFDSISKDKIPKAGKILLPKTIVDTASQKTEQTGAWYKWPLIVLGGIALISGILLAIRKLRTRRKKDIATELQRIKSLLEEYRLMLRNLKGYANKLLMIHHKHVMSRESYEAPEPDVRDEQWEEFSKKQEELSAKAQEINDLIEAVTENTSYERVPDEQKEQMTKLMENWSEAQLELTRYIDDFRRKYENGEAP